MVIKMRRRFREIQCRHRARTSIANRFWGKLGWREGPSGVCASFLRNALRRVIRFCIFSPNDSVFLFYFAGVKLTPILKHVSKRTSGVKTSR